jgi:hypothetical protein
VTAQSADDEDEDAINRVYYGFAKYAVYPSTKEKFLGLKSGVQKFPIFSALRVTWQEAFKVDTPNPSTSVFRYEFSGIVSLKSGAECSFDFEVCEK